MKLEFARWRVQIFIAACINFNEIINGYGVGWSGPMLPKFDEPHQTPLPHAVTEVDKSWIASSMYFGLIGVFPSGYLANKIGRKKSLIIGGALHLISYVWLSFAKNLAMLYIGRFLVGFSINFVMVLGTIYIGEIASPNIRGMILTSMGVSHAIGSLLVYCVAPFVDYAIVNYLGICFNVLFIGTCCFLMESPMYFILKDDEASARTALEHLGRNVDINSELKTMMDRVREQQHNKYVWKELLTLKSNRKSLFITMSLSSFQQGSGVMAVIVYANTIFRYAGSTIQPDIATIIVGATFVIGAIVAPIFIDKYGRRILLMISTGGLCVTMVGLGAYFYLRLTKPSSVENLGWLPLALLVLAQFTFSFGLSIVPNTLSGELFTPKARGLGTSLSFCSAIGTGLISITLFGYVVAALGIHFTFWIYATSNFIAFLFVIFFVPETMGKNLLEIQEMMEK